MGACSFDRFGRTEELFAALNGTGAGHYPERPAPNARSPHLDNRIGFLEVPAHELERLEHRYRSLDAGKRLPRQLLDAIAVTDHTDNGVGLTDRNMGLRANRVQPCENLIHVFLCRFRFHHNDHRTHLAISRRPTILLGSPGSGGPGRIARVDQRQAP